jgi:hypothetical protein
MNEENEKPCGEEFAARYFILPRVKEVERDSTTGTCCR